MTLPVDGRYVAETTLEVLTPARPSPPPRPRSIVYNPRPAPVVNSEPTEPYAAEG